MKAFCSFQFQNTTFTVHIAHNAEAVKAK